MPAGLIKLLISFFCLLFLFLTSCSGILDRTLKGRYNDPIIRVAILKGKGSVLIEGAGRRSYAGRSRISGALSVEYRDSGIVVNGRNYGSSEVFVRGRELKVDGKPYRGDLRVISEEGALTVINNVGLEHYLMGLINHEISSRWPSAAVKAQAVAARSYAFLKIKKNEKEPYDLQSTVMDQVYGGSGTEDREAISAVEGTKGEILFFNGTAANALYHSCCGGRTEDAGNVWSVSMPYLKSVDDEYCTDAPNYFWSYEINADELMSLLSAAGYGSGGIMEFRVLERYESVRVKSLLVGDAEISGAELRAIVGYDRIKSTLFNLSMDGDRLLFVGSGSGHGVGMCQWGAKGMASEGRSYKEILAHYYPGTRVRKVY